MSDEKGRDDGNVVPFSRPNRGAESEAEREKREQQVLESVFEYLEEYPGLTAPDGFAPCLLARIGYLSIDNRAARILEVTRPVDEAVAQIDLRMVSQNRQCGRCALTAEIFVDQSGHCPIDAILVYPVTVGSCLQVQSVRD